MPKMLAFASGLQFVVPKRRSATVSAGPVAAVGNWEVSNYFKVPRNLNVLRLGAATDVLRTAKKRSILE